MNELENFESLEHEGFKSNNFSLSNVYSVKRGGFGKEAGLNTYLSTLTVEELQQDVNFYETLSRDKEWPISHIIQREVDKERVTSIVRKYLLGKGRIVKYFPPIIVALLPRDKDGNFLSTFYFASNQGKDARDAIYEKSAYRANGQYKKILDTKLNSSIVDGLFVFDTSNIFQQSLLCWELDKFFAVVIDGQHRLEALIQAKQVDA